MRATLPAQLIFLLTKGTSCEFLLAQKFFAIYRTRRFITVFTTASHWSISWATWIQFTPSQDPF